MRGVLRHWRQVLSREKVSVQPPANYGIVDATEERIEDDAQYALRIAHSYVSGLQDGILGLRGKSVIELGPGLNFGVALILKSWGASEVIVADRFLVGFQADYHIPLYRRISELLQQEAISSTEPLDSCAAAGRHLAACVGTIETPLEMLSEFAASRFDLTLSNAVLEHVYDPLLAIRNLARISRPGSTGLHQVDFRDHRDFSRPLEYLLVDQRSFAKFLMESHGAYGNRTRPDEMQAMFAQVDFDVVEFTPNTWVDAEYLADFLPRLRASPSPYCDIDPARLRPIGGRFTLKKSP